MIQLIRWGCLILVVFASLFLKDSTKIQLAGVLGLSHYILATYYSRHTLLSLGSCRRGFFALLAVIILSITLMNNPWISMTFYFGLHHVFSEVYIPIKNDVSHIFDKLNRLVFYAFSYMVIVQYSKQLSWLNHQQIFTLFIISLACQLLMTEFKKNLTVLLYDLPFMILPVVVYYFKLELSFIDVLIYHFLVWIFYPVMLSELKLASYLKHNIFVHILSTVVLIIGGFYMDNDFLNVQVLTLGGFLHISLSLVCSKLNPDFLIKFRSIS